MTDICCICLQIIETERLETKCMHIFHTSCFSQWVSRNNNCPECRAQIYDNGNIVDIESLEIQPLQPPLQTGYLGSFEKKIIIIFIIFAIQVVILALLIFIFGITNTCYN